MKLSICVVTMNRARQLKEAIESCLVCSLPSKTEFVIVDNASMDDTEETVRKLFSQVNYPFVYEKMIENLGCGGGRNYAYEKSSGEYVYVLDDDAVIAQSDFFEKAISILDSHPEIITLTSQIFDTVWNANRLEQTSQELLYEDGLYYCKFFCGGSHFIRKSFFMRGPYLSNRYGYEEIPPSLKVWDNEKINIFMPSIRVIHKPQMDKWNLTDTRNYDLLINECTIQYVIKRTMYPRFCAIPLRIAFILRKRKYLSNIPNGGQIANERAIELRRNFELNTRIRAKTILWLIWKFGYSVF